MCNSRSSLSILIKAFPLDFQGIMMHSFRIQKGEDSFYFFFTPYTQLYLDSLKYFLDFLFYKSLNIGNQATSFHDLFRDLGFSQPPFCLSWSRSLVHTVLDGGTCIPGRMERRGKGLH